MSQPRVYVPLSSEELAALVAGESVPLDVAYAVTDALRAEWPGGDEEEWEYAALAAAADASRALVGPAARRLVVALDRAGHPAPEVDLCAVRVGGVLIRRDLKAVMVDTEPVSDDDEDLGWFDVGEIEAVLGLVGDGVARSPYGRSEFSAGPDQ